jgi:hypothetical protein
LKLEKGAYKRILHDIQLFHAIQHWSTIVLLFPGEFPERDGSDILQTVGLEMSHLMEYMASKRKYPIINTLDPRIVSID